MPRYHFNVYDGVHLRDTEETELADWQAARSEAIHRAGEILKDDAQRIAIGEDWRIEVTDSTGLILFRMTFLVVESPALLKSSAEILPVANPDIPNPSSPDLPLPGELPPIDPGFGNLPTPQGPPDSTPGDPIGPDGAHGDPIGPQPSIG